MKQYCARCITFTGESHKDSGKVCQDHSGFVIGKGYSMAIVADGHGSKIRSDIGSKYAIEAITESVEKILEGEMFPKLDEKSIGELKKDIFNTWLNKVNEYHVEHTLTDDEIREIGMPSSSHDVFSLYGTTLVAAILSEKSAIVIQIGDGGCVMVYKDGSTQAASTIDASCTEDYTTSLSDPRSYLHMHHIIINSENLPVAMAVFSDGFEVEEKEDIRKSIAHIIPRLCDDELWYSEICPEIETRTHRFKKDDTSLSVIFDRDTDYVELYFSVFHSEYPSRIEEPLSPIYLCKNTTSGSKDEEGNITENAVVQKENDARVCGILKNGILSKCNPPSEHILETWDHYELMYKNLREVPNDSEYVSRTILDLIYHIKSETNYDIDTTIKEIIKALRDVQSRIKDQESIIEPEIDSNQLFKILDLRNDTGKQKRDVSDVWILKYGKTWFEDDVLKNGYPAGYGKEFHVHYQGEFKEGKRCGEGIEYSEDGTEYHGSFSDGKKNGTGTLFKKGVPVFKGLFVNDIREGKGVEVKYNGDQISCLEICEYKKGVKNGPCEIYSPMPNSNIDCFDKKTDLDQWRSIVHEPGWIKTFVGNLKNGYRNGKCISIDLKTKTGHMGDYKDDEFLNGITYKINVDKLSNEERVDLGEFEWKRMIPFGEVQIIVNGLEFSKGIVENGKISINLDWCKYDNDYKQVSKHKSN